MRPRTHARAVQRLTVHAPTFIQTVADRARHASWEARAPAGGVYCAEVGAFEGVLHAEYIVVAGFIARAHCFQCRENTSCVLLVI